MIDDGWLTDDLAAALDEAIPNVDRIRGFVLDAYNAATGEGLTPRAIAESPDAASRVSAWPRDGHRDVVFIRRQSHLSSAVYGDLASKLVDLGQTWCSTCSRYASSEPRSVVPVRISPRSVHVMQQTPGLLAAYKDALRRAVVGRGHNYEMAPICLQLTFLLKTGRRGDLDNLAKATIDAMQGQFFENDDQIVHLCVQRLTADGDDEAVIVRIQPSRLDEHHEVFDRTLQLGWGGADVVDLDDFM